MSFIFNLDKIEIPIFQLDGGEGYDPISCLSSGRCKPLKKLSKQAVDVLVLLPEHMSYQEEQIFFTLIEDIKKGVKGVRRKKWRGFDEIFGTELKLTFDRYGIGQEGYLRNLFKKIEEHAKNYDLTIIYIPEITRSRIGGPYFKIKSYAIINKIKEQIIIKQTIQKIAKYKEIKNLLRYNDLVWNLALSVFTKLGGNPWKLKESMGPADVFLALSTIMKPGILGGKYRAGIAVLQMYNNWGEYESSVYGRLLFITEKEKNIINIGNDEEKEKFIQLISTIIKEIKDKNIVVHLTDLYGTGFYTLLHDVIMDMGANNVKIIRIQRTSPLRLYDPNSEKASLAWPEVGVHWFLEPGRIAQLYTSGKWKYYPHKPPYAIPSHTIRPIQVSLEYPKNLILTKNDLRDILWLTKLYPYTQDSPRSRIPIDLKLSRKYAQIVASNENIGIPEDITYLY